MARPRVFVSSTYYDLKHLRSALEGFIESMGFEPVLSEKGSVPYSPEIPLDESCYREVEQADLMVLIVGGRYGSASSESKKAPSDASIGQYNSITRLELKAAIEANIPLYVLIERSVYAEHMTFDKNRTQKKIKYAHVNHVGIFQMIDEVMALPKNNPIFPFDRYHEIESWLREQWAGLFRELLRTQSSRQQLTALAVQVGQLAESNATLRKYIESLMKKDTREATAALIDQEEQRREQALLNALRQLHDVNWLEKHGFPLGTLIDCLRRSTTIEAFADEVRKNSDWHATTRNGVISMSNSAAGIRLEAAELNPIRSMLGLSQFPIQRQGKLIHFGELDDHD